MGTRFLRKLYYLKFTGDVLVSTQIQGDFSESMIPQDWDYKHEQMLQPYGNRRDEVGVFQWLVPDEKVEQAFRASYGVRVNVESDPPKLVFDYTPPAPPEPDPDPGAQLILDIIAGRVE